MTNPRPEANLVLEDGREFSGRAFGARGTTFGEAVFNTAMTGYQETLTDLDREGFRSGTTDRDWGASESYYRGSGRDLDRGPEELPRPLN